MALADLPKLEAALDRLQGAYGSGRRYPLYLTEYGYNTRPPSPRNAVSSGAQAAYLNQAEYMAWHDPRVSELPSTRCRTDRGAVARRRLRRWPPVLQRPAEALV